MADLKVIRQATTKDTKLTYEFDVLGFRFLVKNFTEDNIYVTFDELEEDKNKMILIPKKTAQLLLTNETPELKYGVQYIYVIPQDDSAEGVEIQCVLW